MSRRKKYLHVIARLQNSCLIPFKKKKRRRQKQPPELQEQSPEVFCKKNVPKNFKNFTGKHLCWSLLMKLQVFHLQVFKKETPKQMFSCEVCKTFRNTYFENICKRLLLEVFYEKLFLKSL